MFKFNVTPFILDVTTQTPDQQSYVDEGSTLEVIAETSIKAALKHRPAHTAFWLVRKVKE